MNPTVDILMAVYNGARFVEDQIQSILKQTDPRWSLIIQDDCSTDNTMEIVERYVRDYPEKVTAVRRETNSGSADRNFFSMLPLSHAPYVMFCDHDDVWLSDKIEHTLRKMRELEQQFPDAPLLVHTDLTVVDATLGEQAHSMFRLQKLHPDAPFRRLLVQNSVTGCTVMVNRRLLELAGDPPQRAIMHDWWLALIASAFGHIGVVEQPTVLYRQHGDNEVGAKDVSSLRYQAARLRRGQEARRMMYDTCAQAGEFLDRFSDRLPPDDRAMLAAYRDLPNRNKLGRVAVLARYGLWKYGIVRKLGQIALI